MTGQPPNGTYRTSDEDERLLRELRQAASRLDPAPGAVVAAAQASFTWRTIDAELAELTFDSAVDDTTTVRGGAGPRLLAFEAPGVSVEVEVSAVGSRRRLVGQLAPPQSARIELRHPEGTLTVESDRLGRFAVDDAAAGPASLRCHLLGTPASSPVVTDWISL